MRNPAHADMVIYQYVDQYSLICEAQTQFGLIVQRWSCRDVANWLRGLDDCLIPYVDRFVEANVDGRELLSMTTSDLQGIGVKNVGAQRAAIQAVSLLCHMCYDMDGENLQTLTSAVGVQSRNLCNELKRSFEFIRNSNFDANSNFGALPNSILMSISNLAEKTKRLVSWLDRPPFAADPQYIELRNSYIKLTIDIVEGGAKVTKTADAKQVAKNIQILCSQLATICDQLIEGADDPLVIQTATLTTAEVGKRTVSEELGCQIETTCDGLHLIKEVKFQTPADLCRKIEPGDEIIEINGQCVIGWCQNKLLSILAANRSLRIALMLKKRPKDSWNIYKTTPSTPKPKPKFRSPQPSPAVPVSVAASSGLPAAVHRRRSSSFTVGPPTLSVIDKIGSRQAADSKSSSPATPSSPVPTIRLPSEENDEEASGDDRQRRATVSGGSPTLKRLSMHVNRKSSLVPPRSPGLLQRHSIMNDQKPPMPPHFTFSPDGHRQPTSNLPIKCSISSISSNEGGEKSSEDDVFVTTPEHQAQFLPDFSEVTLAEDVDQVVPGADPEEWDEKPAEEINSQVDRFPMEWAACPIYPKISLDSGITRGTGGPIPLFNGFSSLPAKSQKKLAKFFGKDPSKGRYDDSDDDGSSSDGSHSRWSHSSNPNRMIPLPMVSPTKKDIFGSNRSDIALPDPKYGSPELRKVRRLPSSSSRSSNQSVCESDDDLLRMEYCKACRSLGQVDYACYVHRARFPNEKRNTKWAKRWMVLKKDILYLYHTSMDVKTEGVIWLPGCKSVCPVGPEYKTSKKQTIWSMAIGFNKDERDSSEESSKILKEYYFAGFLSDSIEDRIQKTPKDQPSDLLMQKIRRSFNRTDHLSLSRVNSNESVKSSIGGELQNKFNQYPGLKETRSLSSTRLSNELDKRNP